MGSNRIVGVVRGDIAAHSVAFFTPLFVAGVGFALTAFTDGQAANRADVSLKQDFSIDSFRPELQISFDHELAPKLAVEMALVVWDPRRNATLSPYNDAFVSKLEEENFGEMETKLRWKWNTQTTRWPDIYGSFEANVALYRGERISPPYPESILGLGLAKNFSWGKINGKLGYILDRDTPLGDVRAYQLELTGYIAPRTEVNVLLEGENDTSALKVGPRWLLHRQVAVQLQLGVITEPQLSNFEREIRLMFSF